MSKSYRITGISQNLGLKIKHGAIILLFIFFNITTVQLFLSNIQGEHGEEEFLIVSIRRCRLYHVYFKNNTGDNHSTNPINQGICEYIYTCLN